MLDNVTPWYPGDVEPVRTGVYQRSYPSGVARYSRWDGREWMFACDTPLDAAAVDLSTGYPELPWRGLAVKP
jgi:hypothetical protein